MRCQCGHGREHGCSNNSDSYNDINPVRLGHLIESSMMRMSALMASSFLRVIGRLDSLPLINPPIGEALALDAAQSGVGTGRV